MIYAIIGLLTIVLFLCLYILKIQGYRITRVRPEPMTEQEKDEAQRRIEAFDRVMNYDLDQAVRRKG